MRTMRHSLSHATSLFPESHMLMSALGSSFSSYPHFVTPFGLTKPFARVFLIGVISHRITENGVLLQMDETDVAHSIIISDRNVEDDYDLIEEIGQGQYAIVHKAEKDGVCDSRKTGCLIDFLI